MNHNTTPLDESRTTLETSLKKYISSLEECQEALEKMPQNAEEMLKESQLKTKEAVNLVTQSFASIREATDRKEKEVLEDLEKKEGGEGGIRKIITGARELTTELPSILNDARTLVGEWKYTKLTVDVANKVFAIRQRTDSGRAITNGLSEIGDCETVISTEDFVKGVKRGLAEIDAIQMIPMKRVSRIPSTDIIVKRVSPVFAVITWPIKKEQDRYGVLMRKAGGKWNDNIIDSVGPRNYYVMYPLDPETKYEFRVMTRRSGVKPQWSDVQAIKTTSRNPIDYIEKEAQNLNTNYMKSDLCEDSFDKLLKWVKRGKFNLSVYYYKKAPLLAECTHTEKTLIEAGRSGAIKGILKVLKSHENNSRICEKGCEILLNLTKEGF